MLFWLSNAQRNFAKTLRNFAMHISLQSVNDDVTLVSNAQRNFAKTLRYFAMHISLQSVNGDVILGKQCSAKLCENFAILCDAY